MAILSVLLSAIVSLQDNPRQYTNLHVLAADVSHDELTDAMLENLRGLGLRRRQSEGCPYCHVGDMERAVDAWDFASDVKLAKRKARSMMAMVVELNGRFLASLEPRPRHGSPPPDESARRALAHPLFRNCLSAPRLIAYVDP